MASITANQYGWTTRWCTYGCPLLGLLGLVVFFSCLIYSLHTSHIAFFATVTITCSVFCVLLRSTFHSHVCAFVTFRNKYLVSCINSPARDYTSWGTIVTCYCLVDLLSFNIHCSFEFLKIVASNVKGLYSPSYLLCQMFQQWWWNWEFLLPILSGLNLVFQFWFCFHHRSLVSS